MEVSEIQETSFLPSVWAKNAGLSRRKTCGKKFIFSGPPLFRVMLVLNYVLYFACCVVDACVSAPPFILWVRPPPLAPLLSVCPSLFLVGSGLPGRHIKGLLSRSVKSSEFETV